MKQTYLFSASVTALVFGFIYVIFGILVPDSGLVQNILRASVFSVPLGLSCVIIGYINSWFIRRRTAAGLVISPLKKSQLILWCIGFAIVLAALQVIGCVVYFSIVCLKITNCF